jgi:hypothetical protein
MREKEKVCTPIACIITPNITNCGVFVCFLPKEDKCQFIWWTCICYHSQMWLWVLETVTVRREISFCFSFCFFLGWDFFVFWYTHIFIFIFFLYSYAGWEYIVPFTQTLTMYQIHHTQNHPLYRYPLPHPHSWSGFNRYNFCIYIHVYIFFVPYSLSYLFPHHLWGQDLFCPPVLWFCRGKKRKDKTKNMTF